jgi:hypothetical protein
MFHNLSHLQPRPLPLLGANEQDCVLIDDYDPKYLHHMRIHWQAPIFPYMLLCFPYVLLQLKPPPTMTTPITTPTPSVTTMQSETQQSETQTVGYGHYTMSGIAALHTSRFAQGFSNNGRQAAARALLRHDSHIDGTHYQMRTLGGLHPSYVAFNPVVERPATRALTHEDLVKAGLQDVFDAVSSNTSNFF